MAYFWKQTVAPSLSPLVAFGIFGGIGKTVSDPGKIRPIFMLQTLKM